MKNRKSLKQVLFLAGTLLAVFTACQKNDNTLLTSSLSENTLKAAAQTYTAETFDDVMEIGDEMLSTYEGMLRERDTICIGDLGHMHDSLNMGGHHRMSPCTRISKEYVGETLVTTINFGADSCTSPDGKTRLGKIIMSCTGDYWEGEATITFAFEDYYVDGNLVLGTSEVRSAINAEGNREAKITENGSVVMADGSGTITWASEKTRLVTAGTDTGSRRDDVIQVTGTSSGSLVSGNTFTSETLTPLVRNYSKECRGVFVSGTTKIVVSDGTEITVDYGDGTCDNLATVTTNGESETITLAGFMPGPGGRGMGHGKGHGKGHGGK
ncbi:MAG: hypothetical protein A2X22_07965 [Bacteroidetes bacterium GWF2_49_14]|nr:MAG: hypothetical protein A2X22_07965 [Bacteroidetes bacterium GWF2_49_14]HBB91837.1 hypothetical protein [Bacteroidales bacterium]